MKTELEQVVDTLMAAHKVHELGEWKPGEPYMDKELGNIRFASWANRISRQVTEICDKCPFQIKHGDLWLNEQHTEGVPANKLCAKYRQIESCYDGFAVAKTCKFIDKEKFGTYVKEMQAYMSA